MEKVILGVGPSELKLEVMQSLVEPTDLCDNEKSREIVFGQIERLNQFFGEGRYSFAIPGSGSVGMEACLVNILQPGDSIIVGVAGIFGWRIVEMAKRIGVNVIIVEAELGKGIVLEKIEAVLVKEKVKMVCLVHLETSFGVLQSINSDYKKLFKKYNTLFFLDVVASFAGMKLKLNEWGVDIAYASTQKCLGGPSGLALISYNNGARRAMEKKSSRTNWCYDFINIYDHIKLGVYPHTSPVFLLQITNNIIDSINENGREQYFEMQARCGELIRDIFETLNFVSLPDHHYEAPYVKVFYPPSGIKSLEIKSMLEHNGIQIACGIGEFRHKIIRVGTMGLSANIKKIEYLKLVLNNYMEKKKVKYD